MRRKLNFAILCFCLCLVGCSGKEAEGHVGKDWSEKTVFEMSVRGCETENGVILNGGDKYLYYDEATGILTPLCSRADCDHTVAEDCTARLLMEQSTGIIGYYDGYLWFFWEHEGEMTLRRANVDGTGQKDLFQVDIGLSGVECWIYQGVLYLLDTRIDLTEDSLVKRTDRIVAIDLSTGEEEEIFEGTEELLRLRGMEGGRLYYQLWYSEDDKESDQKMGVLYCYDCDTGETAEVLRQEGMDYAAVEEDYLVYGISEETQMNYYILDLETGEEIASFVDRQKGVVAFPSADQFLVKSGNGEFYRFDAAERKVSHIENPEAENYHYVRSVEGGYLVQLIDEDHYITDQYAFLSDESLQNGGGAELLEW